MPVPLVKSFSELSKYNGLNVQLCGTYGVQNLGGHAVKIKTSEGAWKKAYRSAHIYLSDGHYIALENRTDEEMNRLDGVQVIVSGKLRLPVLGAGLPHVSQPGPVPILVEITEIESQNSV